MPRVPCALEAAFLRCVEILDAHALYLGIATEREAMAVKWLEVAPTAMKARDELKDELQGDGA